MHPARPRVLDSMVVCGLHPDLLPSASQPQRRPITSLQLVPEPTYDSQDKYLEINNRLYLKAMYDKTRPSISEIEFLTPEITGQLVVLNGLSKRIPQEWTPVFIRGQESRQREGCYPATAVNIRAYLDTSKLHQQALVLCYRCQQNCETAICDIDVLQGQKREGRRSVQQKQILNLPHEYKTVNHAFVIRNRNKYLIYRRMHNKLDLTYQPALIEHYPAPERIRSRLPLAGIADFCFPEGIRLSEQERGFISFSFILTVENQRTYCSCLIFKELLSKATSRKLGFRKERPYYSEKALCIVSQYSYPDQYCELLQQIYRIGMSKNDVPFCRVVQNLVDELLMVDQNDWGNVALRYTYGGCKIVLETRSKFSVVSDKSIYCLFKFLQVDKIINLFEAILLQKKILLISQSKTVLGLVSEALLCLIFPFKWEQTIVPILPSSMRQFTQAIMPFIIGVPPNFSQIEYEKECIIVDLDNNEIVNDEALPPMPDKLVKQLHKRLLPFEVHVREHTKEYLQNPQNRYIFEMLQQADSDSVNFDPYQIRDAFFEFNLTLMKNYPKYWKKVKKEAIYRQTTMLGIDTTARSLDELYNTQDFLNDIGMGKIGSFGYKFTETSIFSAFIETRAREHLNPHLIFFEQCLELKKSKKENHFIVYTRIDKFMDCPPPNWPIQPGVYYSYPNLPSIVKDEQLHQDDIDLELQPNTERYRQDNRRLREFLEEKCIVCRGFYTAGTGNIPRELSQLNLTEDITSIITKLFMKDELQFIAELIGKIITGSPIANEAAVLNLLTEKFIEQEKIVQRLIKGWDYTQKEQRYKAQTVSVVGMSPKQLQQLQLDRQSIIGEQLHGDFQRIWFQRTMVVFYPSNPPPKDMKKLYIRTESPAMKLLLNQILRKQLQSFTRYLHQRLLQCQVVVWTCQQLRRFRKWLS